MSARALRADPVGAVRASLDVQLQRAVERLQPRRGRADVHGARKQLKRARALVRLLRDALGDAAYRSLNRTLRNCARPLSAARDAEVLLQTLRGVALDENGSKLRLAPLRRSLRAERSNYHDAAADRIDAIGRRIERVRLRVRKLGAQQTGWPVIGASLVRTYRHGRREHAAAKAAATPQQLHKCRKQAKYFWYQLEALAPLAPKAIGRTIEDTHALSDLLGDDHDLFVLRMRIGSRRRGELDEDTRRELQRLIDRKRLKLQRKALALAARIYDATSKQLDRRFAEYGRA